MRTSAYPPTGSAAERAYDFAKWAILSSVYGAGDVITETGLAHELGMSRTPVRDAMTRLQAEGLVHLEPGRGAVVISFTAKDVEDVLEARSLVETFTAERSFAGRAELVPGLEAAHRDMARTRAEHDTAGFSRADREFHEQIVDAAGNGVLSAVYRSLRERQTLFTSAMVRGRDDRMAEAIAEHEKILETLRGDDLDAFVGVVTEHLAWSVSLARDSL